MARALIVGCGCRGRELGRELLAKEWRVRGTTRREEGVEAIEAAGIEAVVADPDRIITLLDHIGDVTLIYWLMGSAQAEPEVLAAIHGPRLERLLEELIDTPVRGVVYEAAGTVQAHHLAGGAEIVRTAERTHRIPATVVEADPAAHDEWLTAMLATSDL